ncbi:unnamed protein product [Trichogramma brassicae]|uniref:Uncharacterized protein n=1 Tax=Trichogramma brassicae TaxID=86971 RepID=A0A6H5IMX4_9HYME|nr:unnamed protein product [Trichogramma brassicae]
MQRAVEAVAAEAEEEAADTAQPPPPPLSPSSRSLDCHRIRSNNNNNNHIINNINNNEQFDSSHSTSSPQLQPTPAPAAPAAARPPQQRSKVYRRASLKSLTGSSYGPSVTTSPAHSTSSPSSRILKVSSSRLQQPKLDEKENEEPYDTKYC